MYLIVLLAASAFCDPLEDGLKSGEALVKLFSTYSAEQGHHYSPKEAPLRLRLFRSELQAVVATNKADLGWTAGLNLFSDMSEEEKAQYLGVNATLVPEDEGEPIAEDPDMPTSGSKDWRQSDAVTPVQNQGRCGSCWAFAAIGSIEGVHKVASGSLVKFSEQEILDCTYEGQRDGCQGGWYHDAFSLVQKTGRLASASQVRYNGRDGSCSYGAKPNSLKALVSGHSRVSTNEDGLVSALNDGPVAVAFQVTSQSQRYRSGLFRDTRCSTRQNHAVTAVGYASDHIIVKNSWGSRWGESGYIRFRRGHHNCGLYGNNAIVKMGSRMVEEQEE